MPVLTRRSAPRKQSMASGASRRKLKATGAFMAVVAGMVAIIAVMRRGRH